jgi:circadian clock protein KaiC
MIDEGKLRVESIEALRYSADEFANLVRRDVEENGTRVVMIDSISGYRLSVSNDNIHERLHELCRYLQNIGVTVLLVNELVEIADFKLSEVGITYLADNVIILRYLEIHGAARPVMGRAIGVLKKRLSDFEKSMHVFQLTDAGLAIGDEPVSIGPLLGGASVLGLAVTV